MKRILLFLTCFLTLFGVARAENASITFSDKYSANTVIEDLDITIDENVSVKFTKGGGTTPTQYYTNGTAVRWYGGGTMTVDAGDKTINKITISFGTGDGTNAITASGGTFSSPNWTGSANSVTFTQGGSSGNRRIAGLTVEYSDDNTGGGTGGGETDPPVDPNPPIIDPNGINDILITSNFTGISYTKSISWTANQSSGENSSGATYTVQATSNSGFQMRTSRTTGITVTSAPAGMKVESITLEFQTAGGGVSVYKGDNSFPIGESYGTPIKTGISSETTVNIDAPYFIIVPTSDTYTTVSKVTVKWVSENSSEGEKPVLKWMWNGNDETGNTVTVKRSDDNLPILDSSVKDLTISYNSSNTSVATVDNGTITILGVGETEITATSDEVEDQYESATAKFTLNVVADDYVAPETVSAVFYASATYSGDASYKTQMTGSNIAGTSSTATVFNSGDISLWIEKINSNTSQINGNQVRWYTNDILHLVPNNGATITKVVINMVSGNGSEPESKLGSGSYDNLVYTWTGSTTDELTLEAKSQIRFTDLTVTYIEAETGGLKKANLSFPETEYSARMGEEFTAPTLSNPFTVPVTYSSSDDSVATVDTNTGEVSLVGAGTTTITATFSGNDTYAEDSASYKLEVKPAMSSDFIVDVITAESFGEGFDGYGDYTYTSPTTEITYKLYAMKGGSASAGYNIQINNNSGRNGGMVVTANPDGYEVVSVAVEQTSAAQIDVYANTDVYTGTAQLYSNPIVGDLVGSIETTSGELDDFTNDVYTGWGLRTSSGARYITKITVTYAIAEGVAKNPPLSFTYKGETVTEPVPVDWNATEFPTLVLPEGITSVTYYSSDTSIAQIDASTGEITLQGVKGETTITATTDLVEGLWKAGSISYTLVVLDPNSKTATFDFTTKDPYGMTTTSNSGTYYNDEISFSENKVTMTVTGKYRSWGSSSYEFRIYTDDNSAIKIDAPTGYILETIEFTGSSLNNLKTETGTYSNGIWESNAGEVDTSVVFTPTGTTNIQTITVYYTLGAEEFYLEGDIRNAGSDAEFERSYKFYASTEEEGAYVLEVASIKANKEFYITSTHGRTFGLSKDNKDEGVVEAGNDSNVGNLHNYVLVEDGVSMKFNDPYANLTFTFYPGGPTLTIDGTKVDDFDDIAISFGNDKTMQSGKLSNSDGLAGHIHIDIVKTNTGALIYVHSPKDEDGSPLTVYHKITMDNGSSQNVNRRAAAPAGYTAATFNEDYQAHEVALPEGTGTVSLDYEGNQDGAKTYSFEVTKSNNPLGVEGIEAEEGEAEYFTLQGVKVANPEKGIYIKVVGGKAVKVVR